MSKGTLKFQKIRRRKHEKKIAIGIVSVFFLSAIISSLAYLSYLDFFQIKNLVVNTEDGINVEQIKSIVSNHLSKSYLKVISKNTIFSWPKNDILADVKSSSILVDSVNIKTKGLKDVDIDIKTKKPVAIFCSGDTYNNCVNIDRNGLAFSSTSASTTLDATNTLPMFISSTTEAILGTSTLIHSNVSNIIGFIKSLSDLNINVKNIKINEAGDYEFKVSSSTKIIVSPDQDFNLVLRRLNALLDNSDVDDRMSAKKIEYIDLRFGNKLYVKGIGEENSTSTKITLKVASSTKKKR